MKSKKNNKILNNFKNNLSYTFLLGGGVALIIIVLFALSALFFYLTGDSQYQDFLSLILLILFLTLVVGILSPFIYSYFANNAVLFSNNKDKVGIKSLFKTAKFGFRRPVKGLLSNFITLAGCILIYMILTMVIKSVVFMAMPSFNEEASIFFNGLADILQNGGTNEAINSLYATYAHIFYIPEMIINLVGMVVISIIFLRIMLFNVLKYTAAFNYAQFNKKTFNAIFKRATSKHKADFYPDFYKYALPIFIIFVVIFVASYLGLYFGFNKAETNFNSFILFITLTSVIIAIVISLLFFPLVFDYFLEKGGLLNEYMQEETFALYTQSIEELKRQKSMMNESDAEADAMLNTLEKQFDMLKKKFDKEEENKDDQDQNDNNTEK